MDIKDIKEHPILFSGSMVRAILDGKKTQTRRVIKPQPESIPFQLIGEPKDWFTFDNRSFSGRWKCPYGTVGDRLWVRETWAEEVIIGHYLDGTESGEVETRIIFRASDDLTIYCDHWHPSIHMPRWASRITLEITDVRVERLQDIREDDARAEGIVDGGCLNCGGSEPYGCDNPSPYARDSFAYLWNSINEKRGFGWHVNPWVWVISFTKM